MKIITRLFILWFLLQSQLIHAQTALCESSATSFGYEYVQSVTFNGVFFQGNTNFSGPGYYNYTTTPIPILQAGTTVPLSVVVRTNGPYQQYVKFWIDFNNNGNLQDPGELVFDQTQLINNTTYTFSGNVTVPPTAFNGPVRMRLIMQYNASPQLCGNYAYGNTFDFGTSVQGGVDPVQLTVNTTGTGNVVSNPSGINTATGLNFANFGQNTNVTLTATPIAPQVFTGWSGAASGTTNPLTVTMDQAKTITANFASNTPPTVTSLAHSNLTSTSVTLSANVTSAGSAPITSRGFYYGTTNNPTTNLTTVSGTTGSMTTNISGLQPYTTYFYRAFATNSVGTTFTTSGTFTTNYSCALIDQRNNGNGQANLCPGVSGTPVNPSVVGTSYATAPTSTKTGTIRFKYSSSNLPGKIPAINRVWINGVQSTVQVGPPSVTTTQGSDYLVSYCFYNVNLPTSGSYTLEYVDPNTNEVMGRCTFSGSNTNEALPEPTLTTNTNPTISSIGNKIYCEDSTNNQISFTISDNESSPENLTLSATSSNQALLPNANLSFSGTGSNRVLEVVFVSGVIGSSTITITVQDESGGSAIRTFTVEVNADKIKNSLGSTLLNAGTPQIIDNALVINETNPVDGALVFISSGFVSGDVLANTATLPSGVTANYNSGTGVLTFTGTIQPAALQTILRGVTINTTSNNNQNRTVTFNVGAALPSSENGHYYQFISAPGITWTNAKTAAEALTLYGMQGYLATITSAAENAFIVSKLNGQGWFGASDEAVEGEWRWVTGPEAGQQFWQGLSTGTVVNGLYNNWSNGEPNNSGNEDYAHFLTNGRWNDYPNSVGSSINGYVVEFGGLASDPCIKSSDDKLVNVNIPPTISSISNQTTCLNESTSVISFTIGDDLTPVANVVVTGSSSNTTLVPNTNIVFGGSGANRTVTITPANNQSGTATITVTATDEFNASTSRTFTLTVLAFPSISYTQSPYLLYSGNSVGSISPTNTGGSATSWTITPALPAGLSFNTSTGVITGTPTDGFNESTYQVTASNGQCTGNTTNIVLKALTCNVFDSSDFSLRGSASVSGSQITLTTATNNQFGALWGKDRMKLSEDFRIKSQLFFGSNDAGADGLAFVIQTLSSNQGSTGGGLGYAGINPSLAVEFDTFFNPGDPFSTDHMAIMLNGNTSNHANFVPAIDLGNIEDGAWHDFEAHWTASTNNLKIYYDGVLRFNTTIDMVNNIFSGNENAYFGFTAATGGAVNVHAVRNLESCYTSIVNQAPTVTSISNQTNCLNQSTPAIAFTVDDDTSPSNEIQVSGTSSNTTLVPNGNIVFGGSGANRTVTVTPVTGQFGTTTITITHTDLDGATASTSFNITFDDTVSPTVLVQNITVALDASGNASILASEIDNGSSDNCAIASITVSPNSFTGSNLGNNTVTLTVTDQKGNVSTQTATVSIIDVTPPTIVTTNSPNDPSVDNYTCGSTHNFVAGPSSCVALVSIAKPVWSDNVGVTSTTQTATNGVFLSNFGDIVFGNFPVGSTTLTFTASDISGNTTTCSLTIVVTDTQNPTISGCPPNIVTTNTTGTCERLVNLFIPTAGDNCSVASVAYNTTGATTLSGTEFPNALVFNVGVTHVVYTVTDASGNQTTCSYTVTVNDIDAPNLITQNLTVELDATGNASVTGLEFDNGSTDNCGIAGFSVSPSTFTCSNLGENTVTVTVTDIHGNSTSGTATVTVVDVIAPIVNCIPWTINDPFGYHLLVGYVANSSNSTDNCSIVSYEIARDDNNDGIPDTPWHDRIVYECEDIGTKTYLVKVTDNSGNYTLCSNIVTINDTVLPLVQTNDITINLDASGQATITAEQINNGSVDNCGIATLSVSPSSFTCADLGANTVTLTVTDVNGNVASAQAVVTVNDTENPAITCTTNQSVITDAGFCSYTHNSNAWNATATDNCTVSSITYDLTGATTGSGTSLNGVAFNQGLTTVTWTATDNSGNTSTCSFDVMVEDNEAPVITNTPSNITVNNDLGNCSAVVTWTAPTAADNCAVDTFVSTHNPGDVFPVGTTTVTYTATDIHGNDASTSFTVTVVDNEVPVITNTPSNITVNNDLGNCSAVVTWTAPTAADNCAVDTFVSTHNPGDVFPVGTTTITYTATDIHGNDASTSFTVTVVDNEAPVITNTPSNITVNNDLGNCSAVVTWTAPTAADNCAVDTFVSTHNPGDVFPVGTTTVTYTATDIYGNISSTQFDVIVQDLEAPVVTCIPDTTVSTDLDVCTYTIPSTYWDVVATDNCNIQSISYVLSGATTASGNNSIQGLVLNLGTTTITWTVVDIYGNDSVCSYDIEVEDNQAPSVTSTVVAAQPDINGYTCGNSFTFSTQPTNCFVTKTIAKPTWFDNCDQNLTLAFSANNGVVLSNIGDLVLGNFPLGVTTVTFSATDFSGNTTTCQILIEVEDQVPPAFSNCPTSIVVSAGQSCNNFVNLIVPFASDNCTIATITYQLAGATTASGNGFLTGFTFNLGITNVTYLVADLAGNITTCTFTVNVQDQTPPVITTQNITANISLGCSAIVALNTNTSDDCGNVNLVGVRSDNLPLNDPFAIGVTTITWTATDAAGNQTTATQTVTVTDVTVPVATAPANVSVNADANSCFATNVSLGSPVATDNCTANLTITNNAPAQFEVGTTTVVWTITDGSGNSTTVSQTVTVTDNQMPSIVVPSNVVVNANSSCIAFNVSLGQATAQDNCGILSITNNAPSVYPLGVTNVTWTATDVNGNIVTGVQTVTVIDNIAPSLVAPANVSVTAGANCQAVVSLGNPVSSDNCGTVTVTNNAPSSFPVGVTTVIWTATDASGNLTTATQTVTVTDVTAPVATAPANVSVSADANSCVATNVSLGTPVATDNCTANLTITNNAPAQFSVGTTTVVWTIADASGNTTTVSQTVTVTDNQTPSIVAPSDVTVNANNSCEASNVLLGTAISADNCGVVTITNNAPAVFSLGATTVTWTATDASGNTATATQVVTIVDVTAPSLLVSNEVQVSTDANSCFATNVNLGNYIALDNCGTVTVTNNAPTAYPTGLTVVTWTATDEAGNVTTAAQNVLVIDTVAPLVIPPANVSVSTDEDGCFASNVNLGNPVVSDNCGISSVTNDAPAQFPVGITTVFWTATDNFGNTTTVSQTVTVTDLVSPVAQAQNITVNLNSQGIASITAMQVNNASTDNCGIASMSVAPSSFTCANIGENTVTLTVVDQNGNTSTATAVVTIVDDLGPNAIANNIVVVLDDQGQASITADQVNNGSTDNCGIASISVSPSTFDCSNVGNNTVVLTVTDTSGNVSTVNANVLVKDDVAPVAITKDITLNVTFEQPVTISPEDVNDGSYDNCSIANMYLSKDTFDCGDFGENIVELTVVDHSGNSSSMSLIVTVNRCAVRVSDVITPNGDGINDTWMIYNIEQYPANQVWVFNRWGDQVFTSKGYKNTWDGSYKNRGQKLPEGASYYYQIDLDGDGVIDQDGWIYITR